VEQRALPGNLSCHRKKKAEQPFSFQQQQQQPIAEQHREAKASLLSL
jgi:hypothetical protein